MSDGDSYRNEAGQGDVAGRLLFEICLSGKASLTFAQRPEGSEKMSHVFRSRAFTAHAKTPPEVGLASLRNGQEVRGQCS